MKTIVKMEWLKDHLGDNNIRIIDCRFDLSQPEKGLSSYIRNHIDGALFFDLDKDLSSDVQEHGGRHPLPRIEEIAEKLSTAGIDGETRVIAYDDHGGPFASRFWWMLRYLGHEKVHVLNGGFSEWEGRGYPVSEEIVHLETKTFRANIQSDLLIEMEELKSKLDKVQLLDSRELMRYEGREEPIDKIAGRIPGAMHFFWKDCFNDDGTWKSNDEQTERLRELDKAKETVVYCGSGVSACPNVLMLKEAGFQNVRLYVGSWSDWITYENPIETDK